MAKTISITQKELQAALCATKRTGPVLSAHKRGGHIILHLCGDKEPVRWKPATPATRVLSQRSPASKKKATKPKT